MNSKVRTSASRVSSRADYFTGDGPVNQKLTAEEIEKFGQIQVKIFNYKKTQVTTNKQKENKAVDEKIPKKLLVNTTLTHSVRYFERSYRCTFRLLNIEGMDQDAS